MTDAMNSASDFAPAAVTHDLTNLGKLFGPIANWIDERMFPWLGLIELHTGTTVRQIAEASKVLFKHELTTADVTKAKRYADIVKKYVPARVA